MLTVKMNKKYKNVYNKFLRSYNTELNDVYNSCSFEKHDAFKYCKDLQKKYNGKNFKIIGANCNFFSVGFEYTNEQNKKMFVYITHAHDYQMEVIEGGEE